MIRLAGMEDLSGVVAIAKKATKLMNEEGSDQWNEEYPTLHHFAQDIKKKSLYVYVEERIEGFIVINQEFAKEYHQLSWRHLDTDSITLHRLAVNPTVRNKGIAETLFRFAETEALNQQLKSIKIDTYSLNTKAQKLFQKLGYSQVGELQTEAREEPFFYYEKAI